MKPSHASVPVLRAFSHHFKPSLLVVVGRGATGLLPVVAAALASRAHGLEVMGALTAALMLAYGIAEVADASSQRHVPRLFNSATPSALPAALASFNGLRFTVLALGLVSSVVLAVAFREVGVWPVAVVLTAVWATTANMYYALAVAEGDYLTVGLGPILPVVGLLGLAALFASLLPHSGVWTLVLAIHAARMIELVWLRARQQWPGLLFDRRVLAAEWRATRFLVGLMLLSALHVRLVVPLVAVVAGTAAAGTFSIGLSILAIVSMSAVSITVPAYRRAVEGGPPPRLAEAFRRTRVDFLSSLVVSATLVLLLLFATPWIITHIFVVEEVSVGTVTVVLVLSGLFEGLMLFANVWYHACHLDHALLKLSAATVAVGWVALVVGNQTAGLMGMAWAFLIARALSVVLLYEPVVRSIVTASRRTAG